MTVVVGIQNINSEFVTVKCRLNVIFKKWTPIEIYLDNNVKISDYSDIREIMMNVVPKEKEF